MFDCLSLFGNSRTETENSLLSDLSALAAQLNFDPVFRSSDVQMLTVTFETNIGKKALMADVEDALPHDWFCKEIRETGRDVFEVVIARRKSATAESYLF